jgi:murein L,D-transpeptidase YcbB/YkuD
VRVERALELARLLLDDPLKWGEAQIAKVLGSERTTHVALPRKVPVLLTYGTAWPDDHQRVHFRRDACERDAHWLEHLGRDFVLHKPLVVTKAP